MSPEMSLNHTTFITTFTLLYRISPNVYYSKNSTFTLFAHHQMLDPLNRLKLWRNWFCMFPLDYCLVYLSDLIFFSETHKTPAQAYDVLTKSTCKFWIFNHMGPSDNPMQSEECAHIGSNGNFNCHICQIGGTKVEKESNEGFHALFSVCFLVCLAHFLWVWQFIFFIARSA